MKLFLKHLFRSIRQRPLQPIVIVLTITLSVLVSVVAFSIKQLISDEINSINESKYGTSDIVIQLNSNSKSRFMFEDEVEKILSGKANAVGSYELVFTLNDETVFAKAVDFNEIDTVFDYEFIEYGEIKEEKLSEYIIVSQSFAEKRNLSLGDVVELMLLGENISYKIAAISKTPFFNSNEIIVDISGVMKMLSKESIFISALDNIKPYSTIYIDVIDDRQVSECLTILNASDKLSDKTIVETSGHVNEGFVYVTLPMIINVCIALCSFLTSVVVFNCIYILSKQRIEENESFILAGTKKKILNFLQYVETILYWIIGAPLGICLSYPTLIIVEEYLSFRYATSNLTILNMALGSLLSLLVAVLTVTLFIVTRGQKKNKKSGKKTIIILFALMVVSFFMTMVSHGNMRLYLGTVSMITTLLFVFFATPYLISKALKIVLCIFECERKKGKRIKFTSLYYALKNFDGISVLKNTARLVASLVIVVLSVAFLVGSAHGNLNATEEILSGEYIVLNATDRCYNEIKNSIHLEKISKVYQSKALYKNGYTTLLISTDNEYAFGKNVKIKELPRGNEAVLSTTDAKLLDINVGEEFSLKIDGCEREFLVKEIVDVGTTVIFFDSDHFNISPNMILLKAKEGANSGLLKDLTTASATELATIIPAKDLRIDKIESNSSMLKCANLLLHAVIVYALIGIVNNLFESYRARKGELSLYQIAGISKSRVLKMKTYEVLSMFFFGLLIGMFGTIVLVLSMDKAFNALDFELISFFKYLI